MGNENKANKLLEKINKNSLFIEKWLVLYITTGDKRYFAALENKFEEIYDVYENGGKGRIYNKSDGFDVSKASSFAIK